MSNNNLFVKRLASNEKRTRDDALRSLRTYLATHKQFEEIELLKLWKGLFYCMWMSDLPLVQQRLAADLAGLVDVLPARTVIPFLDAFWKTMAREWIGIDVLRMNKFLLLVRRYLGASFSYFAQRGWPSSTSSHNTDTLQDYLAVLVATPLNPTSAKIPDGLRYHIIDIYVDELDKADPSRDEKMPLDILLEPLRALGRQSNNKKVRERVAEALADERLVDWRGERLQGERHDRDTEMLADEPISDEGDDEEGQEVEEYEEEEWDGIPD